LEVGVNCPKFCILDQAGKKWDNQSLRGKRCLIYFYPRDMTSGCITEACGFKDLHIEYKKLNILILGVSTDGEKSHCKFIGKYDLPFPLLIDEDHKMSEAFGVWGEKKFLGKTFNGIHRMSFLLGKSGKIEKAYHRVKPAEHAKQVLNDLSNQEGNDPNPSIIA
jgi:peroxiredoxin Q/BCP